jgi:hypothetical protein
VNEADIELLTMAVVGPLNVVLPLLLVSLDFRLLLTAEQRARTWPDATIGAAALLIGPLMLPFHFAMSRWVGRNWGSRAALAAVGFGAGTVLTGVMVGLNYVIAVLVEWLATGRVQGF